MPGRQAFHRFRGIATYDRPAVLERTPADLEGVGKVGEIEFGMVNEVIGQIG